LGSDFGCLLKNESHRAFQLIGAECGPSGLRRRKERGAGQACGGAKQKRPGDGSSGRNSPRWFLCLMNSPAVKAETEFVRRFNEAI
jgi:hypothetical protein